MAPKSRLVCAGSATSWRTQRNCEVSSSTRNEQWSTAGAMRRKRVPIDSMSNGIRGSVTGVRNAAVRQKSAAALLRRRHVSLGCADCNGGACCLRNGRALPLLCTHDHWPTRYTRRNAMDETTRLRDAAEEIDSLLPPYHVDRRGFVKTALSAGFAAAVSPVVAQTMITTDTQGLTAGEVKIAAKGGEMPAYRAMPAGKKGLATVLVVQEVFGVHEHIKDMCRRFAKAGYLAVAPELYVRQGDPAKYTEIPKLVAELVSKVPDEQVNSDLDAAVAYAKGSGEADTAKLAVTGFCWGGRITWLYAAHNP